MPFGLDHFLFWWREDWTVRFFFRLFTTHGSWWIEGTSKIPLSQKVLFLKRFLFYLTSPCLVNKSVFNFSNCRMENNTFLLYIFMYTCTSPIFVNSINQTEKQNQSQTIHFPKQVAKSLSIQNELSRSNVSLNSTARLHQIKPRWKHGKTVLGKLTPT